MSIEVMPATGQIDNKIFTYPVRVYYEDTDAGGIVYYANYLKFAERARSEFLRALHINQQQILQEKQCGFVVRACHIEYLSSAYLDDALQISCQLTELGSASAVIHQEVRRGDEVLAQIDVKLIFMSLALHRPTRILPEIKEKFTDLVVAPQA